MGKIEELDISQELINSATKVFAAVAVQTNSTNTTVKFKDFIDDEGNNLGDFTVNVKWKRKVSK